MIDGNKESENGAIKERAAYVVGLFQNVKEEQEIEPNTPIDVATYRLSNSLPEDMKEMLPEPEEIARRLKIFEKE